MLRNRKVNTERLFFILIFFVCFYVALFITVSFDVIKKDKVFSPDIQTSSSLSSSSSSSQSLMLKDNLPETNIKEVSKGSDNILSHDNERDTNQNKIIATENKKNKEEGKDVTVSHSHMTDSVVSDNRNINSIKSSSQNIDKASQTKSNDHEKVEDDDNEEDEDEDDDYDEEEDVVEEEKKNVKVEIKPKLVRKGVCKKDEWAHILIYNRVPKTASTSALEVAFSAGRRHYFRWLHDNHTSDETAPWNHLRGDKTQTVNVTLLFTQYIASHFKFSEKYKLFIDVHTYWVDTSKYGWMVGHSDKNKRQPVYINIIRNPISRFVSHYYFRRKKDKYYDPCVETRNCTIPYMNYYYMDVNECAQASDYFKKYHPCLELDSTFFLSEEIKRNNLNRLNVFATYFCGFDYDTCHDNINGMERKTRKALEVMRDKYIVVGIAERFRATLALLSKVVPQFFPAPVVERKLDRRENMRDPSTYVKADAKTTAALQRVLKYDMKLYQEAVRIFEQKMIDCGPYPYKFGPPLKVPEI